MNSYDKAKQYIIKNGSLTPQPSFNKMMKRLEEISEDAPITKLKEKNNPLDNSSMHENHNLSNFIFGGLYHKESQILYFDKAHKYVAIQLNTPLPSYHIIANNNVLIIQESGIYELYYNILANANKMVDVAIAARKNKEVLKETRGTLTLNGDTDDERLTATTFVKLLSNDQIDLAIEIISTLPNNLDIILDHNANATLTLKKIANI